MRGVLPAQHNPEREPETERERKKERETHTHSMDLHFKRGKLRLVGGDRAGTGAWAPALELWPGHVRGVRRP